MTDEELKAQLYQKMADEQAAYREYLLSLPPDEILGNAYEYATREDILMALENDDLSRKQATALLKSEKPLEAVYRHHEAHGRSRMEDIWSSVEAKANAIMRDDLNRSRQQER